MDLIGSNWIKLDQIGSNWNKLEQTGLNWHGLDKHGQTWSWQTWSDKHGPVKSCSWLTWSNKCAWSWQIWSRLTRIISSSPCLDYHEADKHGLEKYVLDKHGIYKHGLYILLISFWNNLPADLDLTLNLVLFKNCWVCTKNLHKMKFKKK